MTTWILVGSAARARVFRAGADADNWRELMDFVNAEDRQQRQDFVSDKPGRVMATARGQHQTFAPTDDPHERAAQRFARDVVGRLQVAFTANEFDRLVVVAPPHFLGLLRDSMSSAMARAVCGEVVKDLTREDPRTLPSHVGQLL